MQVLNETESGDSRMLAMVSHLMAFAGVIFPFGNLIGTFLMFQMKKHESDFIADHALESFNFQLSMMVYGLGLVVLLITIIGIPFAFLGAIALFFISLIFPIIGASRANNGEYFRYPLNLRFFKPGSF